YQAPLLRLRLLRLGAARHLLVMVLHHLICDGWSVGIITRNLARLYDVTDAEGMPEHPFGAERMQPRHDAPHSTLARDYWRQKLAGAQWSIDLPRQRARRGTPAVRAIRVARSTAPTTRLAVARLASRHGATPFMLFLAVFANLLRAYGDQRDVAVGTI